MLSWVVEVTQAGKYGPERCNFEFISGAAALEFAEEAIHSGAKGTSVVMTIGGDSENDEDNDQ